MYLTLNTASGMFYYGTLPRSPPKPPPAWNQQMVIVQFKFEDVIKTVPFSKKLLSFKANLTLKVKVTSFQTHLRYLDDQ